MGVVDRVYARDFKGLLTRGTLLLVLGLLLLPAKSYAQTITISSPSADPDGLFTVSWNVNPGSGYGGYTVLMQRFNGGSWTSVTNKGLGSQSHPITVTQQGSYQYKVDYGYCTAQPYGCPMTTGSTNIVTTIFDAPPTISNIANQTINEDGSTASLGFTVGDVLTAAASLTVTASSSNLTLVPINSANLTLGGSGANRTITVTPAANQSGSATITVTVTDAINNPAIDTFVVTVNAVNDAPMISGVDNIAVFAAAGHAVPVTLDDSVTINDLDSTQLNEAKVSITGNFGGSQDQLIYSTINGITGSYSGTGVLTLSGTATLAQYKQALESVKYWNSSSTPSTATRTISFTVRDTNNANSAADTTTILVTGNITPSLIIPDEFDHDLNDTSFLPTLGAGYFVALTQGKADVHNGAAQYRVPLELPPAVNDLKPKLSLSYNSLGRNGLIGVGWSLSGLSTISRCPPTYTTEGANKAQASNPRYTTADRLCLDGQKLEIASPSTPADNSAYWAANAEYRTEIDGFARIKAYSGHQYFEVHTKDGRILTYGRQLESQKSRIYAPGQGSSGPINIWALDKVQDRYGNQYTVHYQNNNADGDYYPTHIVFEPDASVVFTYQDRDADMAGDLSDMPWGYDKGYLHKHPKLLDKITTYINVSSPSSPSSGTKVREYDITYTRSATTDRYRVSQIQECGSSALVCAKPLTFDWQAGELGFESTAVELETATGTDIVLYDQAVVDLNNDGYMDIVPAFPGASKPIYWGRSDNDFDVTSSWTITGTNATWTSGRLIATPRGFGWIVIDDDPDRMGVVEVNKGNAQLQYQFLAAIGENTVKVGDFNKDGLDDFINENTLWLQDGTDPADFTQVSTPFSGTLPNGAEVAFADYTSDGLADFMGLDKAYANAGNNQFTYDFALPRSDSTGLPIYGAVNGTSFQVGYLPSSQFRNVLDLNGDGLQDLAWHRKPVSGESNPGYWYAKLNMGNGFTEPVDDSLSSGTATNQYSFTHDWDKDGRQDLIVPNTSYNGWRVLLATYDVDGFAYQAVSPSPFPSALNSIAGATVSLPQFNLLRGDYNNDGLIDVAYAVSAGVTSVWYAKQQQPDLLKTVTDGFGAEVKFEYSPLAGDLNNGQPLYTPSGNVVFPQRHAPRNMQVVKKHSVSDGAGGYRHRYFNYTGAKQDVRGRGLLGFEKIVVTDTSQDTVTTTNFKQDFPFIGQIASAEIKDSSGDLISITDNYHAIHGSNDRFPFLDYSILRQYGLTTSSTGLQLSITKVDNTFDSLGNLTAQVTSVGTALSGSTVTNLKRVTEVSNTVNNDTTNWLLGFITQSVVHTSVNGIANGGTGLRTVTTQFEQEPGKLDVKIRHDFVGTPVWKTTTTTRNANGIVTAVASQAGDLGATTTAARTTTYVITDQMYPTTRTNGLNHATTLVYDQRFGFVSSETDPNNRVTTREYDALGRRISETAADDTVSRIIRYECATAPVTCPSGAVYLVATEVTNDNASGKLGAPLMIVYYDKLQRELRQETYSLDGAVIKVDQEYYPDGRLKRVSEPYTGFSPDYWTVYADYDALNRPATTTKADGGSIAYAYSKVGSTLETVKTVNVLMPSSIQITRRYTDALGQVTQVVNADGTAIETRVDYTYDTQGNLATTKVNTLADTLITITHDLAGNKTSITDPDAGNIDFEYNGFGELRRQVWDAASDKSMTFTYDVLGRKTSRTDDPVVGSNISYTWTWDSNNKKGLLGSQAGNGMAETYVYDSLSRLQSAATTITGMSGSRVFAYTYDAFSRPQTVSYPESPALTGQNNLEIEHLYHAAGMQVQTRDISNAGDPKLLWTVGEESDARGKLHQQRFGNGVITLSSFDPQSGRVTGIRTGWPTVSGLSGFIGSIQDLAYDYDTLGNLQQRTSAREPMEEFITEAFEYDSLNRLTESATTWLETNAPTPRISTYGYDLLGNLISRSDIGTMTYGAGTAGVHAITALDAINPTDDRTYGYDAYGNMTTRGSETLEYDVYNKPTKIGGTYFTYGPDHARFKQVDGSGRTTYYINGGQYEEIVESGTTTERSHVGGYLTRSTTGSATTLTYLHPDHLGSTEAMTNASGNMITVNRMSFDPWGNRRDHHWESNNPTNGDPDHYPTTHGFTGHEMLDQVNLIHMNGRVYDPAIGRFLSADLFIQSPYNSQSFNRYTYVFNNPLSGTDPSGYRAPDCAGCDEVYATLPDDWGSDWGQTYTGMDIYHFMMVTGYYSATGYYGMGMPDANNFNCQFWRPNDVVQQGTDSSDDVDDVVSWVDDAATVADVPATAAQLLGGKTQLGSNGEIYRQNARGGVFRGNGSVSTTSLAKLGKGVGSAATGVGVMVSTYNVGTGQIGKDKYALDMSVVGVSLAVGGWFGAGLGLTYSIGDALMSPGPNESVMDGY